MKISVVVPSYNHSQYLEQRMESILNQTYQNFEIILLDDCSTDGSQKILKSYCKHPKVSKLLINKINSGNTFLQWKKGITLAQGNLIWIAESDDFCENDFLEKMVKSFSHDEKLALAFCQSHKIDSKGKISGNWLENTAHFQKNIFQTNFVMCGNEFIEKYLIAQNVIPNASAVLFKKNIAMERGIPDKGIELKYNGDWLFYLKMLLGNKISFVNESLNYFRYHENSVIAGARRKETIASIVERDENMRKNFVDYLLLKKPENADEIIRKNRNIRRIYQLEKAFSLYRSKRYRKSMFTMIPVLDLYFNKLEIYKKIRKGLRKLLVLKGMLCCL